MTFPTMKFLTLVAVVCVLLQNTEAGNDRPYGVDQQGFTGAGSVGQDASANGYAGR